jgi:hypothetical protein
MKKRNSKFFLFVTLLMIVFFSGCYAAMKTPLPALSINHNGNMQSKVGNATCYQYIWVIGQGDCSVATAMKNGGINKVHHVDTSVKIILMGAYSEFTVVAYGE